MKVLRIILTLILTISQSAVATEVIHSFHSEIDIRVNGDIYVTENIIVQAEGKSIKRGIYRDFPTTYTDTRGRSIQVGFEVLRVSRNGEPEAFQVKDRSNGKRLYIGHSNIYLSSGQYDYQIVYLTTRQIGFFDDFDELYWNVTGNDWGFPILEATARVTLPDIVTEFHLNGYTGVQGSTEQNLRFGRMSDNQFYFETSKPLKQREGLTIVVGWPKGIVVRPDAAQRRAWFIEDNLLEIIALGGVTVLLLYYCFIWMKVGRDPSAGSIVPLYESPAGYSPASMRFVSNMGYDKKCFTTAIINLAVKGGLQINDDSDKTFSLDRLDKPGVKLAAGEAAVLHQLFKNGNSVVIAQSQHSLLSNAINKHKNSLKRDYEKKYFVTNRWYLVPGVLLSLLTIALMFKSIPSVETVIPNIVIAFFIIIPVFVLITSFHRLIRGGRREKIHFGMNLIGIIIFAGFIANAGFLHEHLIIGVSWIAISGVLLMLLMNYFFHNWLKAPTLAGRKLLDQIEGFKHYLEIAEQDELALTDQPTFNTDLYEKYLPYAIALNLENAWTAKLNRAVRNGLVERDYRQPAWYHGHRHRGNHFSDSLSNSFNSAISSSSVAPGSSSGSSGGSSGGGGGGGGGGGW